MNNTLDTTAPPDLAPVRIEPPAKWQTHLLGVTVALMVITPSLPLFFGLPLLGPLAWLVPLLGTAAILSLQVRSIQRSAKILEGTQQMALEGRTREAEDLLRTAGWLPKFSGTGRGFMLAALGMVRARQGQWEEALRCYQQAVDSEVFKRMKGAETFVGGVLLGQARAAALCGQISVARKSRERAEPQISEPTRKDAIVTDLIIALRCEQYAEAIEQWRTHRNLLERTLTMTGWLEMRCLVDFARHEVGESTYRVESPEADDPLERRIRGGEFDYLATSWPALREYLQMRQAPVA